MNDNRDILFFTFDITFIKPSNTPGIKILLGGSPLPLRSDDNLEEILQSLSIQTVSKTDEVDLDATNTVATSADSDEGEFETEYSPVLRIKKKRKKRGSGVHSKMNT